MNPDGSFKSKNTFGAMGVVSRRSNASRVVRAPAFCASDGHISLNTLTRLSV